jgi:peptidoglycan/xylan/chitin deacetylase (PgdA/CDA1 family)
LVREALQSPDERRIALLTPDRVIFRSADEWRVERSVEFPDPLHAAWLDDRRLLVGGAATIEVIDSVSGQRTFVGLSQVARYALNGDDLPVAVIGGRSFAWDRGWRPTPESIRADLRVSGGRFRVFLESQSGGSYRNIVMVRRTDSAGTSRLFPPPVRGYEPFPDASEPVDLESFSHGSRTRGREVAFAINAIDDVAGLTEILNTLAWYDVMATFFVNGEFIRRNPAALAEIAASGHEVGSLFSYYFDMSDRRFRVTREFIIEGLARNEDDYFDATGRELSLLWHAPYYFVSQEIVDAGRAANYTYVGRDVDSLDWVPRRTDDGLSQLYLPSAALAERILDLKRPGSVISMQIGMPDEARGGRDDYLFQRLDVLINGLLELGYRVVPVSRLIENAR